MTMSSKIFQLLHRVEFSKKWKREPPKKVFNFETAYKRFKCLHVLFQPFQLPWWTRKRMFSGFETKFVLAVEAGAKLVFCAQPTPASTFLSSASHPCQGGLRSFLEFRLNDIICFNKHLISIFINRAMQQCFGNGIFNCLLKLVLVPLK